MTELKLIGVLAHPLRPQTDPIAERIVASLRAHNVEAWVFTDWARADVQEYVKAADMVVAIGGDGAMLRAARACAPHNVPVLGVHMGQLGFLTEIDAPARWDDALQRLLAGDYWIEERMMIRAAVIRDGVEIASGDALNETVVRSSRAGRMVRLDVYIDGDWATTYSADAVVTATATGSTAYALACGGPILPPELRNILIIPAAAHLSMDRPIVLSEGATVELWPASANRGELVVVPDGEELAHVRLNDRVRIQASERTSRFVRQRTRNYFYRSLLDRLEPRVSRSEPADNNS